MLSILVAEKGAPARRLDLAKDDVTLGRLPENDVVLSSGGVSKQHARLVRRDGRVIVADLRSTNGTYVNGQRIEAPRVLGAEDQLVIGDYVLRLVLSAETAPPPGSRPASTGPVTASSSSAASSSASSSGASHVAPPARPTAPRPSAAEAGAWAGLMKTVHDKLIGAMDLRRLDMDKLGDGELHRRTADAIRAVVRELDEAKAVPAATDREKLVRDVLNEALGLGPLEELLADDDVSEIMVNHASQIYIEKRGKLSLAPQTFSSNEAVRHAIERIVAPIGRRIDESSPLVDARLKDGSRVNAVIPPLALKGPTITIRKFRKERLTVDDLVRFGTLTRPMAGFLELCVKERKNIVISGGTGSGKTTLLNVISSFIPEDERIVTVEDAAELQLPQAHWIQLETRPANIEGKGQISIRDLVRNCLRMRPDRIVVGECRGGEALDMLQAMNTGHDGSLTTLHANAPRDAIARLETMVLMSGMELPVKAIREQVASAVDIIVQQTRFADGSRRITYISEVSGMEGDIITLQDIFRFKQEGFDGEGRVHGRFVATGFVPRFYDDLQRRGIPVDLDIFREG